MTAPVIQPPSALDITIPEPPPRDQDDGEALYRFLARASKSGQFNATLQRQERAALLALFGSTLSAAAIAAATANATSIGNPPTQAQMVAVQTSLNAAIGQLNLVIARANQITTLVASFLDAVNANLKSLPATTATGES